MRAFNLFDPDVVFDNHEYQFNLTSTAITKRDMMICSHILPTYSDSYKDTVIALAYAAFDQLEKDDLSYAWYSSDAKNYSISSVSGGVGSSNTAQRGTMHILMETLGSNFGTNMYERRIASHASAVTGILNYLDTNSAKVKQEVKAQRETIIENGKTYKEDDVLILKATSNYHPEYNIEGKKVNLRNGGEVDFTFEARMADTIAVSRVAPTAYVIPAGETYTQKVLELMDLNGISYQYIPTGSAVRLQQYLGTITDGTVSTISLTEDMMVAFPEGAYVFCMNQVDANILAIYMEPDTNHSDATLAKQGIITPTDGVYPIYRYIHDLNNDGFIDYTQASAAPTGLSSENATVVGGTGQIAGLDAGKEYEYKTASDTAYTAVPAGSAQIADLPVGNYQIRFAADGDHVASLDAEVTVGYSLSEYAVYVDSTNGSSAGDAYTQATAASTYNEAKVQLDKLMEHAPAGTTGVIRILGTYTMTKSTIGNLPLPNHDYPLMITGGTLIFKDTANDRKWLRMGGDTTFDHITLEIGSNSSAYYMCADGYKLTIGKNVTTTPNGSNYFNIMGSKGVYSNSTYAAQTDVTVQSGTWANVYAGGYVSSVTGDARITLSDCSVNRVCGSYNGNIGGDVYIDLLNVTVREGALYAGNIQKNDVAGNVTLVLGKGVSAGNIYTGSKTGGNVGGTVTVVADGIDLAANTVFGNPANTTGTVGGLRLVLNSGKLTQVMDSFVTRDGVEVVLGCDQTEGFTLPYDITLDLNGCHVAAVDTNGRTMSVKDSATDDYTGTDSGSLPADTDYEAFPGYMVITEEDRVSFHKYALELTEVTLKTADAGLTYRCFIAGDEKVREQMEEFGIAMRLFEAADEASILADTGSKTHVWRTGSMWQTGSQGQELTGVAVVNIMKSTCTSLENQDRASKYVYGTAYLKLKNGDFLFSQAQSRTLQQVVQEADSLYDTLTSAQTEALHALYTAYSAVIEDWNIPNILENSR